MILDATVALLVDATEEALLYEIEAKQGRAAAGPPPTRPGGWMLTFGLGHALGDFVDETPGLRVSGGIFTPITLAAGMGYRLALTEIVDLRTGATLSWARSTNAVYGASSSHSYFQWGGLDILTCGVEGALRFHYTATSRGFIGLGSRVAVRRLSAPSVPDYGFPPRSSASLDAADVTFEGLLELGFESGLLHGFETTFRWTLGQATSGVYTGSFGVVFGVVL